jgi:hypothetical protein
MDGELSFTANAMLTKSIVIRCHCLFDQQQKHVQLLLNELAVPQDNVRKCRANNRDANDQQKNVSGLPVNAVQKGLEK